MGIISNSTVQNISNTINDFLNGQFDPGSIVSYPGSGTLWVDLSGTFSGGTLVGSPTFSSGSGGVFNFDGVNDYVDFLSDSSVTSSSSIQIWVRDTGATDNNIHQIVNSVGFNVGDDGWFSINKTATNKWGVSLIIGGVIYSGESTVSATTSWTNLAIVSDPFSAGALLYVNGVLDSGAGGIKGSRDPVANVLIGTSISGTEFFPGQIGYTLFYGNSLDASQVLQNYNATSYRYI
jgi:hypothetical protein